MLQEYRTRLLHGTYTGPRYELVGKTALLITNKLNPDFSAQFDDVSTGLGHGWWPFPTDDFKLDDPEVN